MRSRLLTPSSLLLFAMLNIAIGADLNSSVLMVAAGAFALACVGVLAGRRVLRRRSGARRPEAEPARPLWQRGLRHLSTAGLVIVGAYTEWVILHVVNDPWVDPPPEPVRGEVSAHGPDFGKGVTWHPDLCRPATNPGLTAAALMRKDDPFPLAWVIARSTKGVAAIDVQRSVTSSTIRFYPNNCTRFHGDVQPVRARTGLSGLAGYADAECVHGGDALTIHVDFDACTPIPSQPKPAASPGRPTSSDRDVHGER